MALSNNEVHTRLVQAYEALGAEEPCETVIGASAFEMARRILTMLQLAILMSEEKGMETLYGVQHELRLQLKAEDLVAIDKACGREAEARGIRRPTREEYARSAVREFLKDLGYLPRPTGSSPPQ